MMAFMSHESLSGPMETISSSLEGLLTVQTRELIGSPAAFFGFTSLRHTP
jgi:hypothetical protein